MNYQQGLEDGKKSQSKGWIISGLIHLFGILLIHFYKIPKDFKYSKEYTEGYIKGVKLRRLKYWTFGLLSIIFVITISENSQSTQKQLENNKTNSITGVYYIERSNGYEYTTELKENGEWVHKTFKNGDEQDSGKGFWKIENIEVNFVKETKRIKILIFNGRYYLEITEGNCLYGSSRETQNIISSKNPNLYPSDPEFLRSMNLYSPISLYTFQSLCKDEELSNQ